ncbi:MAG: hypothetical protein S4CHLAM102_11560 [Chlamydiia bacterium]|nr:hypothetical protein [Chlamydiia bacterium]
MSIGLQGLEEKCDHELNLSPPPVEQEAKPPIPAISTAGVEQLARRGFELDPPATYTAMKFDFDLQKFAALPLGKAILERAEIVFQSFVEQGCFGDLTVMESFEKLTRLFDEVEVIVPDFGAPVSTYTQKACYYALLIAACHKRYCCTTTDFERFVKTCFMSDSCDERMARHYLAELAQIDISDRGSDVFKLAHIKKCLIGKFPQIKGDMKGAGETALLACFDGDQFLPGEFEKRQLNDVCILCEKLRGLSADELMAHFEFVLQRVTALRLAPERPDLAKEFVPLQTILIALAKEIFVKDSRLIVGHTYLLQTLLGVDPELKGSVPPDLLSRVLLCQVEKLPAMCQQFFRACFIQFAEKYPNTQMHALAFLDEHFFGEVDARQNQMQWVDQLRKCIAICTKAPQTTMQALCAYRLISKKSYGVIGVVIHLLLNGYRDAYTFTKQNEDASILIDEKVCTGADLIVLLVGWLTSFSRDVHQSMKLKWVEHPLLQMQARTFLKLNCKDGCSKAFLGVMAKFCLSLARLEEDTEEFREELSIAAIGFGVAANLPECKEVFDWLNSGAYQMRVMHDIAVYAQENNFACGPLFTNVPKTHPGEFAAGRLLSTLVERQEVYAKAIQHPKVRKDPKSFVEEFCSRSGNAFESKLKSTKTDDEAIEVLKSIGEKYLLFAFACCGQFPKWKDRCTSSGKHFMEELIYLAPGDKEMKVEMLGHFCQAYYKRWIRFSVPTDLILDDFRVALEALSRLSGPTIESSYLMLQHAMSRQRLHMNDPNVDQERLKKDVKIWMEFHKHLKQEATQEEISSPSPPQAAAAGADADSPERKSPPARRKKKKKDPLIKNMPLVPGVYAAQDYPLAQKREQHQEQISPYLSLKYRPFDEDPRLAESLDRARLLSRVSHRQAFESLESRSRNLSTDPLGLITPSVVPQRVFQEMRRSRNETRQALIDTSHLFVAARSQVVELRGRVTRLASELTQARENLERAERQRETHKRRDQEARLRANALQEELEELKAKPPIIQQVVVQGSCEVEEEVSLYCPITQQLPEDPVVLASAEEAVKMGFHEEGYNAFVLERSALKEGVRVKQAPRRKREMIQLARMKKEGIVGDLSFAKDAIAQMKRANLNLNSQPVTNILNRLGKVLMARIDVGSGVDSRCLDLVGKTNSALEIVLKECLKAKKVDIANPSFAHQRVSIGNSHKLVSLANLLLSQLKFLKDQKAIQREIDQMDQNGFDRFDGRYLGDQKKTPLTTLMEEVESIDEDACLIDPASQIALIEQVREIYTMCSNVIGLAAQLMQATHDEFTSRQTH